MLCVHLTSDRNKTAEGGSSMGVASFQALQAKSNPFALKRQSLVSKPMDDAGYGNYFVDLKIRRDGGSNSTQ